MGRIADFHETSIRFLHLKLNLIEDYSEYLTLKITKSKRNMIWIIEFKLKIVNHESKCMLVKWYSLSS